MKFFIPLLLASACLAIPQETQAGADNLAKRIAEPGPLLKAVPAEADVAAVARCRGGDYGKGSKGRKKCFDNCGKGKPGQCTQVSNPGLGFTWNCVCPVPKRALEKNAGAGDLANRTADPEPELVSEPGSSPVDNAILVSRAGIEARARCVHGGSYEKKSGCATHCKGKGKCITVSNPGLGFTWTCTCPSDRRDSIDNLAGAEYLAKRIAEPVVDFARAEDAVLEDRDKVEA